MRLAPAAPILVLAASVLASAQDVGAPPATAPPAEVVFRRVIDGIPTEGDGENRPARGVHLPADHPAAYDESAAEPCGFDMDAQVSCVRLGTRTPVFARVVLLDPEAPGSCTARVVREEPVVERATGVDGDTGEPWSSVPAARIEARFVGCSAARWRFGVMTTAAVTVHRPPRSSRFAALDEPEATEVRAAFEAAYEGPLPDDCGAASRATEHGVTITRFRGCDERLVVGPSGEAVAVGALQAIVEIDGRPHAFGLREESDDAVFAEL